jgi:hypothetical protein
MNIQHTSQFSNVITIYRDKGRRGRHGVSGIAYTYKKKHITTPPQPSLALKKEFYHILGVLCYFQAIIFFLSFLPLTNYLTT